MLDFMDWSMYIMYIISIFMITILTLMVWKKWRGQKRFPSPTGKPIVGVLFDLSLTTFHFKFHEWSQQYGDIYEFTVMGQRFIVLNSVDVAREILLKEPNATITAARPSTFAGKYVHFDYSDIIYASPDPKWTKRRKLVYQLLHAYGKGIMNIQLQITRNLTTLNNEIQTLEGQCIDPRCTVEEFILNTIEVLLIGKSTSRDSELHRIITKLDHLTNDISNIGNDLLYTLLPILRYLPLSNSRKIKEWFKLKQELLETLEKLTEDDTEKEGIFHSLKRSTQERDVNGLQWFSEINLGCLLVNIIGTAYLTTRGTLLSLIQILAKRPELQKSLQNEIDNVIGTSRKPALADKQQCPLVEAVMLETLRYISHIPIFFHCTSNATEILDVPVDKSTTILLNFWTMHHSAKEWHEPFSFIPERYLDEDGSLLPSTDPVRKKLLVFGAGKRNCVGEVYAKSRIFLFVATILQNFTIMEPDDSELPDLLPREMESVGVVLQPKPYKVRFSLRRK